MNFDAKVNYYKALGLKDYSCEKDIKKAFYDIAKKCHPDSSNDCARHIARSNEERFKEASNAYEVLSNANSKQ